MPSRIPAPLRKSTLPRSPRTAGEAGRIMCMTGPPSVGMTARSSNSTSLITDSIGTPRQPQRGGLAAVILNLRLRERVNVRALFPVNTSYHLAVNRMVVSKSSVARQLRQARALSQHSLSRCIPSSRPAPPDPSCCRTRTTGFPATGPRRYGVAGVGRRPEVERFAVEPETFMQPSPFPAFTASRCAANSFAPSHR